MPETGLEPARSCDHQALNLARLPIPPLRLISYGFWKCGGYLNFTLTPQSYSLVHCTAVGVTRPVPEDPFSTAELLSPPTERKGVRSQRAHPFSITWSS